MEWEREDEDNPEEGGTTSGQEDDEQEEEAPSKKRMRDFVGAPVCSKCGALFSENARFRVHTATLYKTDCSVCRATTYKNAADLVANQSADAMDAAAAAVGAGRKKRKLERLPPPSHHEDLLDAVGSLQRFRQARTFKAASYGNRKSSEEKLSSSAAAAIHGNLESSAERPVETFMTAHPGDDETFESWLHTFGLEKKIVQHMLKSRKRSSNRIPWSTGLRVADHPELFPDITTRDAPGELGLERSLLMTDRVKQYRPSLEWGDLVWRDDFDIKIQGGLVVREPLRPVPTALREALRSRIRTSLDDEMIDKVASRLDVHSLDAAAGAEATAEQYSSLHRQALECAVGRHVESLADAAASMVARLCKREHNAAMQQRKAAVQEQDMAIFLDDDDSDEEPAAARVDDRPIFSVGWQKVLNAVRTEAAQSPQRADKKKGDNLPRLHLTPQVLARFEARVAAVFAGVSHEPETLRRVPASELPKVLLEKGQQRQHRL